MVMKCKVCSSALVGLVALVVGIVACSNGVENTASQATGSTTASSTKKSIPVTVAVRGGSASTTAVRAKSLSSDSNVKSAAIDVYDASSGALVGSGSLANLGSGNGWAGSITVSETGPVIFEATALGAKGNLLYVAQSSYPVTGTKDSVPMVAGPVSLMGGSFQGQPLQMGSSICVLSSGPTGGFAGPDGITTDGALLHGCLLWGRPPGLLPT